MSDINEKNAMRNYEYLLEMKQNIEFIVNSGDLKFVKSDYRTLSFILTDNPNRSSCGMGDTYNLLLKISTLIIEALNIDMHLYSGKVLQLLDKELAEAKEAAIKEATGFLNKQGVK